MIPSPTLHEALKAAGLISANGLDDQRRNVYRISDWSFVGSFTAKEAWDFLAFYVDNQRDIC